MDDHTPPDPTLDPTPDPTLDHAGEGPRSAPDAVWAQVRADYSAGLSARACCDRHGVGRSALYERAAREGWRRADQPWRPPAQLDPWDEGLLLEEKHGGDLDAIDVPELTWVAWRRMLRCVLRGDAAGALQWKRVCRMLDEEQAALDRLAEEDDAFRFQLDLDRQPDSPDCPDSLSESGSTSPASRP